MHGLNEELGRLTYREGKSEVYSAYNLSYSSSSVLLLERF